MEWGYDLGLSWIASCGLSWHKCPGLGKAEAAHYEKEAECQPMEPQQKFPQTSEKQ